MLTSVPLWHPACVLLELALSVSGPVPSFLKIPKRTFYFRPPLERGQEFCTFLEGMLYNLECCGWVPYSALSLYEVIICFARQFRLVENWNPFLIKAFASGVKSVSLLAHRRHCRLRAPGPLVLWLVPVEKLCQILSCTETPTFHRLPACQSLTAFDRASAASQSERLEANHHL